MSINFGAESPTNYSERTLCVMLLDISGSMVVDNRLDKLNEGLRHFYDDIKKNSNLAEALEVSVIAFDHDVHEVVMPSLVDDFDLPILHTRNGLTDTAKALKHAMEVVADRKDYYRHYGISYKRPWIIMMTDGLATSEDSEKRQSIAQMHAGMDGRHFHYFPIGISLDANEMKALGEFAHPSAPALPLKGLNFSEFFEWLSNSLDKVSTSRDGDQVSFDPPTWMQGFGV